MGCRASQRLRFPASGALSGDLGTRKPIRRGRMTPSSSLCRIWMTRGRIPTDRARIWSSQVHFASCRGARLEVFYNIKVHFRFQDGQSHRFSALRLKNGKKGVTSAHSPSTLTSGRPLPIPQSTRAICSNFCPYPIPYPSPSSLTNPQRIDGLMHPTDTVKTHLLMKSPSSATHTASSRPSNATRNIENQ